MKTITCFPVVFKVCNHQFVSGGANVFTYRVEQHLQVLHVKIRMYASNYC